MLYGFERTGFRLPNDGKTKIQTFCEIIRLFPKAYFHTRNQGAMSRIKTVSRRGMKMFCGAAVLPFCGNGSTKAQPARP
jgi:hypothetical protein